jgi:RimJ/RimL family protein N-acetyltransferase
MDDTLFLSICVGEDHRRRGIAFAAMKALAGGLPEGIRRIEAAVDAENTPSLRLFEKLGFRRSGWAEGLLTYRLTR